MTTTAHTQNFGKVKPRRKGLAAWLTHHTFRRLVQTGVFLFIAFIAVQYRLRPRARIASACTTARSEPVANHHAAAHRRNRARRPRFVCLLVIASPSSAS